METKNTSQTQNISELTKNILKNLPPELKKTLESYNSGSNIEKKGIIFKRSHLKKLGLSLELLDKLGIKDDTKVVITPKASAIKKAEEAKTKLTCNDPTAFKLLLVESQPLGKGKYGSVYPVNKILINVTNKRHKKLLKLSIKLSIVGKSIEAVHNEIKGIEAINNEIKIIEKINAKDMNGKITPKISTIIYNKLNEKCGYYMHRFDNNLYDHDKNKINKDGLVTQAVNCMIKLHSLGIVHNDIHEGNIVIRAKDNDFEVRLIDLGSSLAKDTDLSKEYAEDCSALLNQLEKHHNDIKFVDYKLAQMTFQEIQEVVYALSCRKDIEYKTCIGKEISECMNSKLEYSKKLQDVFGKNGILTKYLNEIESQLDKKEKDEENKSNNDNANVSNQSECESKSSFKAVNFKK